MNRASAIALALMAALAGVTALPEHRSSAQTERHRLPQAAAPTIPCDAVPVEFCTAAVGCQASGKSCKANPSAPPINCTQLFQTSGTGVVAAEAKLLATMKAAKDETWQTMQGTQDALSKSADAMKSYDSALKDYNSSLTQYAKEARKLETMNDELAELTANCSIPTPAPTCPAALASLKAAIAKQTAACGIKWIDANLAQTKMVAADAAVSAADDKATSAMSAPAKTFAEIAGDIAAAEAAKRDAVAFWTAIKTGCIAPPAWPSVEDRNWRERVASTAAFKAAASKHLHSREVDKKRGVLA